MVTLPGDRRDPEGRIDPFRVWLGRELHDRVGQTVAAVVRNLELAEGYGERDPAAAARRRDLAIQAARQALEDVRCLSAALRRPVSSDSLVLGLDHYLQQVVPPEMDAEVSGKGDESLIPMPVRDELFLVLREAVLNAVRHSGGRRITVVVSVSGGRVQAEVADDGRGLPDDAARGTGLSSMHERVATLGGTLTVAGGPRAGTRVKVQVPLRRGA